MRRIRKKKGVEGRTINAIDLAVARMGENVGRETALGDPAADGRGINLEEASHFLDCEPF
jgi:hypothetical protein